MLIKKFVGTLIGRLSNGEINLEIPSTCIQSVARILLSMIPKCISNASLETLEDKGALWQNVFIYSQGTILDNCTDHIMLRTALSQSGESESVFYRAMDCNGYARYWHGYLVFLKPLLSVISFGCSKFYCIAVFSAVLFSFFCIVQCNTCS